MSNHPRMDKYICYSHIVKYNITSKINMLEQYIRLHYIRNRLKNT